MTRFAPVHLIFVVGLFCGVDTVLIPQRVDESSGAVFGQVIREDGRLVRGARVTLVPVGGGPVTHAVVTGPDGRYLFAKIPFGDYTLSAHKAGLVTMAFGQREPTDPVQTMELASGEKPRRADFVLPSGAVLTGAVVDDYGDPVPDVFVSVMKVGFSRGVRVLVSASAPTTTNDIGEFRLASLAGGQLFLQATAKTDFDRAFETALGYAPAYYPGAEDPRLAEPIDVAPGQNIGGLVVPLSSRRLARITGAVKDSEGSPLDGGVVNVMTRDGAELAIAASRISPGGAYAVAGVPPGHYLLQAFDARPGKDGLPRMAALIVNVADEDVHDLELTVPKFAVVQGRVVLPAVSRATGVAQYSVRVGVRPWDASAPLGSLDLSRPIDADGKFVVRSVPGRGRVFVKGLPPGLVVSAIRLQGTDIIDTPLLVDPDQNLDGLEISVGPAAAVSGIVVDHKAVPVRRYVVVVFPEDRARWTWQSRYIAVAQPEVGGGFTSSSLPPGHYRVLAVPMLRDQEQYDYEFLEMAVEVAERLVLTEGRPAALQLRLATVAARPWRQ